MLDTILAVAGLAAAFIVPGTIEYLKRPKLEIVPGSWVPPGPAQWTFASVRIRNKQIAGPVGRFRLLPRDSAQACIVEIDYYRWDSREKVIPTVTGRWDSHPQPERRVPLDQTNTAIGSAETDPGALQPSRLVYDPSLDIPQHDITVGYDIGQVSVAILRNDEAFAFANESYAYIDNQMGKPEWKLAKGTYRIVITVRPSNAGELRRAFKLEYLTDNFREFQLQEI
jgi:hypothetical protein